MRTIDSVQVPYYFRCAGFSIKGEHSGEWHNESMWAQARIRLLLMFDEILVDNVSNDPEVFFRDSSRQGFVWAWSADPGK